MGRSKDLVESEFELGGDLCRAVLGQKERVP